MRCKRLSLGVVFFLVMGMTSLYAQEAVPASGGNASGSGGAVSYTVGQVFYTAQEGTGNSVAQGVQQPYEISVVTGIEQAKFIQLSCSVYPNPTTDYVTLKVQNYHSEGLSYQLFDSDGRLVERKKIGAVEETIPMSNLSASTYFLKVLDGGMDVKTFKIIKN